MSQPYKPPLPRRAQAVQSARARLRQRWRWWWLVPLAGLVPVAAAAVFAGAGGLSLPGRAPVASAPTATLVVTAAPVAAGATTAATLPPQAQPSPTAVPTAQSPSAPAASPTATPARSVGTIPAATAATSTTTASAPAASTQIDASGPFRAYRVQPGDTVKFVAQMYGVSTTSIIQASGLQNPDLLRVGQVLTVPAQPGYLYRLQPGETLDLIAARTGVSAELIATASNVSAGGIKTGDVILIPDQTIARSK